MSEFAMHAGVAPQSHWSPLACEAPHHAAEMPMRPIRHTFAEAISHDEMMCAHFSAPRPAARESYHPHRNSGPPMQSHVRGNDGREYFIQRRPDPFGRYYGPGYFAAGFAGGVAAGYAPGGYAPNGYPPGYGPGGYAPDGYGPDGYGPAPSQPAPSGQLSQLGATLAGFAGGLGVMAGVAIALFGLMHHGGVGSVLAGGVVGALGFATYKAATKVTDPVA